MMRIWLGFVCLLIVGIGCSKEDEVPEDPLAEAPLGQEGTPSAEAEEDAQPLTPVISAIESDFEQKNYNEAIGGLAALNRMKKTPQQEKEYLQAVHAAQEQLRQQAQTDPQAQQALRRLGYMMTGR